MRPGTGPGLGRGKAPGRASPAPVTSGGQRGAVDRGGSLCSLPALPGKQSCGGAGALILACQQPRAPGGGRGQSDKDRGSACRVLTGLPSSAPARAWSQASPPALPSCSGSRNLRAEDVTRDEGRGLTSCGRGLCAAGSGSAGGDGLNLRERGAGQWAGPGRSCRRVWAVPRGQGLLSLGGAPGP